MREDTVKTQPSFKTPSSAASPFWFPFHQPEWQCLPHNKQHNATLQNKSRPVGFLKYYVRNIERFYFSSTKAWWLLLVQQQPFLTEYLRAQYYKAAQTTGMRKEETLCSLIQAKVHPDRLTSVSPPLKCALRSCHCQSPLRLRIKDKLKLSFQALQAAGSQ